MTTYKSIKVSKGSGGFGGPLVITPTEQKHKFVYVVGGGERPAIVDKIEELTGMEAVNGFRTSIPDDEIALAIIDCGGTLRCGIYPKKGIPTINVLPTGKAGPLAQYITEDIYVSKVSNSQIELYQESEEGQPLVSEETASTHNKDEKKPKYDTSKKMTQQGGSGIIGKIGLAVGSFMSTINQSAREAVQTMLTTVIPFMAFVSLIIGLIQGSGVGNIIANFMAPLAGNVFGLIVIGFICSVPFLSPLLGPGAVVSQVIGALIGVEIGKGNIPPQLALPALFAINTQNGCDFIPVALGLAEANSETVEVGVPAVLYSRFINGVPRVVVAWLASFGLYR